MVVDSNFEKLNSVAFCGKPDEEFVVQFLYMYDFRRL